MASILHSHQATCALPLKFLCHPLRVWRRAGGVRGREMLRAARLSSSSLRRRFCTKASSLGQAQALRPFLVEQYRGWTDPGVEFPSLSSSECEPLSLRQARPARPLAARRRHPPPPPTILTRTLTHILTHPHPYSHLYPHPYPQLLALADDRSLRQWESLSLGYPAFNEGSLWLREEIASLYASDDLG